MRFIRQFGQPSPDKPAPTSRLKDLLPLGSILVALAAIFAQMFTSYQNQKLQIEQLETQTKLKQYELTFKPKQEAYTAFMKAAHDFCESANAEQRNINYGKLGTAFYGVEPFLDRETRSSVIHNMQYMSGMPVTDTSSGKFDRLVCIVAQADLHFTLAMTLFNNRLP